MAMDTWSTHPELDPRELLDRAPFGYLVTRVDGTILWANATFGELVATPVAYLHGLAFTELLDAASRIFHESHVVPVMAAANRIDEVRLTLVPREGDPRPVLLSATAHEGPKGRLVRMAALPARPREHGRP